MKYLIVGTGGVGGNIAAFLSLAGKDVTCIARGAHLEAIQAKGMKLKSGLKGECVVPLKACTAEEYSGKADVIFVCVKGYSLDSVTELIAKAAQKNTIVIPILNVFGTGPKLQSSVPAVTVLDGCIYIVGFISAPGEITQTGTIFRLVFGAHPGTDVAPELLALIQKDLQESGIKAIISTDIRRDTFIKWAYISATACTAAYYDVPMGEIQKEGAIRNTYIGLCKECAALGVKLGITFETDLLAGNLKTVDSLSPESTTSMQRDLVRGQKSEIKDLLFDMIALAEEAGLSTPIYRKVAEKFQK
ncbi:2-dehydropantoate 2-reductase [termite gut metagenome]|uniref:2-dehydropantoate 2-reductase n=1 Tax=termite gut metagenome TaxID=433724 RepID=A0A5J4S3H0_9ZZZZ